MKGSEVLLKQQYSITLATAQQGKSRTKSIWVMGYKTTKIFTLITEESFLDLDLCTIAKYGKLTNIGALSFISKTSMSTMTWATLGLIPLPASLRTSITSSYLSWTSRSNGIPEINKNNLKSLHFDRDFEYLDQVIWNKSSGP